MAVDLKKAGFGVIGYDAKGVYGKRETGFARRCRWTDRNEMNFSITSSTAETQEKI